MDNVVSCDLVGSTNIDITGGVISTTGLATTTQLGTKQDTITPATDLSCNSLTTNQLIVDNREYFDTIVIRRPTGFSGNGTDASSYPIILNEIQCWVNAFNLLPDANTTSIFADWVVDKYVDIGQNGSFFASNVNNNVIGLWFITDKMKMFLIEHLVLLLNFTTEKTMRI